MSTSDIILNIEAIALTGDDLVTIARKMGMPNSNWILYNDLGKVTRMEDLFMGDTIALYVLLEIVDGDSNVGHWITLILNRDTNTLIHYDSYGFNVDQETSITGQDKGLLLNLIRSSQLTHDVNKYQHQSNDERANVNTCGRFCSLRAVFFQLTNKEFNNLIIEPPIKDRLIANPDVLVASLTGFLVKEDHDQHARLLEKLNRPGKMAVFS